MPTDIKVKGKYLYLSTNSSKASDLDLYIYDISDFDHLILVSSLNTGPGISSMQIVGNYIYLANKSINAQLQVIDATDLSHLKLISSIKLPGIYNDNTTIGMKILYDKGKVF